VLYKKDDMVEELLKCREELDNLKDDLDAWINSLEELSEIEGAFETDMINKLHGKAIFDIGTDCVKPLYIALKYEPEKIIGIDENLSYPYASDLQRKSELFAKTKIKLYKCSFFDKENLGKILKEEKQGIFDFVLVSKTLHHLRTGKCIANERDKNNECQENEECCIYKFEERKIFRDLLRYGKRVIVYEWFYPNEKDEDKVRGRGGYSTVNEWKQILSHLSKNYRVKFFKPVRCYLDKKGLTRVIAKLRQLDFICFSIETKQAHAGKEGISHE